MSKFITEAKQEKLERDDGKQADPETVIDLAFSDLVQRGIVAKAWGFSREESSKLIKVAIRKWLAYNMEQANGEAKEHGLEPSSDTQPEGVERDGSTGGVEG